jgi:hypothetical protein
MTDHNPIEGTTALNMLLYMVPMPLFLSVAGARGWVMRSRCVGGFTRRMGGGRLSHPLSAQ